MKSVQFSQLLNSVLYNEQVCAIDQKLNLLEPITLDDMEDYPVLHPVEYLA